MRRVGSSNVTRIGFCGHVICTKNIASGLQSRSISHWEKANLMMPYGEYTPMPSFPARMMGPDTSTLVFKAYIGSREESWTGWTCKQHRSIGNPDMRPLAPIYSRARTRMENPEFSKRRNNFRFPMKQGSTAVQPVFLGHLENKFGLFVYELVNIPCWISRSSLHAPC